MKKLYSTLMLLALGLFTFTLTSCEEDDDFETAAVLDGIWHGSLGTYYSTYYDYGYAEWETEFRFNNYSTNATSGSGIQIDYDPSYWSDYQYYPFKWDVANRNIYLHYDNGDEYILYDYALSNNYLSGRLVDITNGYTVATIRLERTSYWPWDTYAKTATTIDGETRATTTTTATADDPHYGKPRVVKVK